ncbi:MAG: hypothetical protein HC915_20485 [Anaerolineae bacterium]|nr:hypothetical protein [Anaerolineae bacterium]
MYFGNAQARTAQFRSIRDTYNCTGMVFASRRTWIDESYVERILRDDGYRLVAHLGDVSKHDVVVYRDQAGQVAQVGMVINKHADLAQGTVEFTILSKWGRPGEYRHAQEVTIAVPIQCQLIRVWVRHDESSGYLGQQKIRLLSPGGIPLIEPETSIDLTEKALSPCSGWIYRFTGKRQRNIHVSSFPPP